jgi:hypothetical protein
MRYFSVTHAHEPLVLRAFELTIVETHLLLEIIDVKLFLCLFLCLYYDCAV